MKKLPITRQMQIDFACHNASIERSRREYVLVKAEAAGKCIQCGIRKRDSRWLKCWACRKGLA